MEDNRCRLTLTFDNGPDPHVTPYVLDLLNERGLPAVFFPVGERLEDPQFDVGAVFERELAAFVLLPVDVEVAAGEREVGRILGELEAVGQRRVPR